MMIEWSNSRLLKFESGVIGFAAGLAMECYECLIGGQRVYRKRF